MIRHSISYRISKDGVFPFLVRNTLAIAIAIATALAIATPAAMAQITIIYNDTLATGGGGGLLRAAPTWSENNVNSLFPGMAAIPSYNGNTVIVDYIPDGGLTKTNPVDVYGGLSDSAMNPVQNNEVNIP